VQGGARRRRNGVVAHEDWMVTFLAAAGAHDIKQQLMKGGTFAGRQYRAHPDGYNQLDYLGGKVKESPGKEFWYINDDGQVVAARYLDWKVVFLENRRQAFGVWREPFTDLRVPLLFHLRRDPFEKAQHNSNTYNDWFLERVRARSDPDPGGPVPPDHEGLPAEPISRLLQPEQDRRAVAARPVGVAGPPRSA
jgi:arylsulfatase A-like enzyme